MLRKRIIFTLIYQQGFFTQSRNFRLQQVGDIHWLESNYKLQKIAFSLDELIILNASRQEKVMRSFAKIVSQVTDNVFIPVAAGGGIRSLEDAALLFEYGADKIVLNSILFLDPVLVKQLIDRYGSQSIIASIDYKKNEGVFIQDGRQKLDVPLIDYINFVENLGVGELYLNSIDQDGTGFGYDLDIIGSLENTIKVPLIIAGGAGNAKHLLEGLSNNKVNAVATANLFNFVGDGFPNARARLLESSINIVSW